ncbi:MAG: hypothetical protein CL569_12535, partial [Alphaproteobacteria bacterium]|nr:hypothetical protein [Alphaproteobacteria bacterium]
MILAAFAVISQIFLVSNKSKVFLSIEFEDRRNLMKSGSSTLKAFLTTTTTCIFAMGISSTFQEASSADLNKYIDVDFISEFVIGTYEDDTTTDSTENNPEMRVLGELHVGGKFKADNGLTIGGEIEFDADNDGTNNIDEIYMYVSGDFGRFEVGDQDGAGDKFSWDVPSVGFGQVGGDWNTGDDGFAGINPVTEIGESSDDTKITYYLPKIRDLKVGISWAPLDDDGGSANLARGQEQDQIEAGAEYSVQLGGSSATINAAYYSAEDNDANDEDHSNWGLGLTVENGPITFGIGHVDNGDSGRAQGENVEGTTIGIAYETGPWGFGASYNFSEFDAAASQDQTVWSIGGAYTYEPSFDGKNPVTALLGIDLTVFDRANSNNGLTQGDDGWVAIGYLAL